MIEIKNIKVSVVKQQNLIDFLQIKLKANEELCVDPFCLWKDKYCISPDCVFWEVIDRWYNHKSNKVIDIECRVKKYDKDGSYSIRMDKADFVCSITIADYLAMATEIHLVDFIRFNYNPRIIDNQKLLMEYIN